VLSRAAGAWRGVAARVGVCGRGGGVVAVDRVLQRDDFAERGAGGFDRGAAGGGAQCVVRGAADGGLCAARGDGGVVRGAGGGDVLYEEGGLVCGGGEGGGGVTGWRAVCIVKAKRRARRARPTGAAAPWEKPEPLEKCRLVGAGEGFQADGGIAFRREDAAFAGALEIAF